MLIISDNDSIEEDFEQPLPKLAVKKRAAAAAAAAAVSPKAQPMKTVLDMMMEEATENGKKKSGAHATPKNDGPDVPPKKRKRNYTKKPLQEKSSI